MEGLIQEKIKMLEAWLATHQKVAVAFSGGVDSTFLLAVANRVLGKAALAVTMTGPNFPSGEFSEAKEFCERREIPQLVLNMPEEVFDSFKDNPEDRCYICKKGFLSYMKEVVEDMVIVDGTNADDANDYRPGRKALKELGILSPLEELGFTKEEIRTCLKAMNISIWDKPACACLASRIPFGQELTFARLKAIDEIEDYLRALGFCQVRLRDLGDTAVIEVGADERYKLGAEMMDDLCDLTKSKGFKNVYFDMAGYAMGNMNKRQ